MSLPAVAHVAQSDDDAQRQDGAASVSTTSLQVYQVFAL